MINISISFPLISKIEPMSFMIDFIDNSQVLLEKLSKISKSSKADQEIEFNKFC